MKKIEEIAVEKNKSKILEFKKRMLCWDSPVEYVNNMYGSHPDDAGNEYFSTIFSLN